MKVSKPTGMALSKCIKCKDMQCPHSCKYTSNGAVITDKNTPTIHEIVDKGLCIYANKQIERYRITNTILIACTLIACVILFLYMWQKTPILYLLKPLWAVMVILCLLNVVWMLNIYLHERKGGMIDKENSAVDEVEPMLVIEISDTRFIRCIKRFITNIDITYYTTIFNIILCNLTLLFLYCVKTIDTSIPNLLIIMAGISLFVLVGGLIVYALSTCYLCFKYNKLHDKERTYTR